MQCVLFSYELSYGRGAGVGRGRGVSAGLGVGEGLGVEVGVAVGVAVAVAVGVAVGVGVGPDCAQYLPPVFKGSWSHSVSAPDDHFAAGPDCRVRRLGAQAHWWCWWLSNCPCRDYICRRC